MHRRTCQSKSPARSRVHSSSGDSCSNSDSDNSLELQTASDVINSFLHTSKTVQPVVNTSKSRKASDVINSFLHTSKTVQPVVNTPKSRKASDVINSFLKKNKIVDQASHAQFENALDVINSYLRKDNFGKHQTKEFSGDSNPESELVSRKRQRRVNESSTSGSDSDSDANRNAAKKRRVENGGSVVAPKVEPIVATKVEPTEVVKRVLSPGRMVWISTNGTPDKPTSNSNCAADNTDSSDLQPTVSENLKHTGNNNPDVSVSQEEGQQGKTVSEANSSKKNGSSKDTTQIKSNAKPKPKAPTILKVSFTREVFSRKMKTRRVVEQQTTIRDCPIPKEKYDRALAMLNATECRSDETPVDYNLPRPPLDIRKGCNGRRHAEATYDTYKLKTSVPISLTRIVFESDNCLKRENWSQMAELIYFGCGLMKTEQARRAIGTTFFTVCANHLSAIREFIGFREQMVLISNCGPFG